MKSLFLHRKFTRSLFCGHLNVNSVRNKVKALEFLIKDKFDVFLVSHSKRNSSFPIQKFQVIGFFAKTEINTEMVECFILTIILHAGKQEKKKC